MADIFDNKTYGFIFMDSNKSFGRVRKSFVYCFYCSKRLTPYSNYKVYYTHNTGNQAFHDGCFVLVNKIGGSCSICDKPITPFEGEEVIAGHLNNIYHRSCLFDESGSIDEGENDNKGLE